MKVIDDPTCTLCPLKVIESTPIAEFCKMIPYNLSKIFEINLAHTPIVLIFNDLSNLGLTLA